jgi:glycosyltransferase involved in cell wall biosynthesis
VPPAILTRRIQTLLPMACDGVGPSATCINIMNGAASAGFPSSVFAVRRRVSKPIVPMHTAVPKIMSILPYAKVSKAGTRRLEKMFLASIGSQDIAFLWPTVSLEMHHILHERGVPIVLEGINTRMKSAKLILDKAYEDFGEPPSHGITQRRIDVEEQKYTYASAIFAPNRLVEDSLVGSPLENAAIPSSYGVDTRRALPIRHYDTGGSPLTFLFCGSAGVRKGAHHLLDAWKHIGGGHRLQFLGSIDPLIRMRYKDLLASDRVEMLGFVNDPHPYFSQCDVFLMPSLEEGGPQVTYEAALHGRPIIASPMGASRMGDDPATMLIVDPASTDHMVEAMERLIASVTLREALGRAAHRAALGFNWMDVGRRRAALLAQRFPL